MAQSSCKVIHLADGEVGKVTVSLGNNHAITIHNVPDSLGRILTNTLRARSTTPSDANITFRARSVAGLMKKSPRCRLKVKTEAPSKVVNM